MTTEPTTPYEDELDEILNQLFIAYKWAAAGDPGVTTIYVAGKDEAKQRLSRLLVEARLEEVKQELDRRMVSKTPYADLVDRASQLEQQRKELQ